MCDLSRFSSMMSLSPPPPPPPAVDRLLLLLLEEEEDFTEAMECMGDIGGWDVRSLLLRP